ncbi:lytic murein transglycosylase [Streptomyces sp. TRM70308]|uniref:lytic transglycosylase domain-containing protein n=1 Tax=Streptomyces sp. TRM70308 TaxID=3131932 RepID=UPI003D0679C9
MTSTAVAAAAMVVLSASQAPGAPLGLPQLPAKDPVAGTDDPVPQGDDSYHTELPPLESPVKPGESAGPGGGGTPVVTGPREAGIPATVLAAYRQAETALRTERPGCNLPWQLLAAIGKVESGQARGGDVDANGTTVQPILGPQLDGNGFALIRDTDGGAHDGDATYDRAVGPMQFIPSTWASWAADGNGDGAKDPNNIFDAALAAGRYLCANGRDLSVQADLEQAILSYNRSTEYLRTVLSWLEYYREGVHEVPDTGGVLPDSPGAGNPDEPATRPATKPTPKPEPEPKPGRGGGEDEGGNKDKDRDKVEDREPGKDEDREPERPGQTPRPERPDDAPVVPPPPTWNDDRPGDDPDQPEEPEEPGEEPGEPGEEPGEEPEEPGEEPEEPGEEPEEPGEEPEEPGEEPTEPPAECPVAPEEPGDDEDSAPGTERPAEPGEAADPEGDERDAQPDEEREPQEPTAEEPGEDAEGEPGSAHGDEPGDGEDPEATEAPADPCGDPDDGGTDDGGTDGNGTDGEDQETRDADQDQAPDADDPARKEGPAQPGPTPSAA